MAVLPLRRRLVAPVLALLLVASVGGLALVPASAQEQPAGLDNVVAVTTHTCKSLVVRADGTVWGWGCNSDWDLGATGPGAGYQVLAPIQAVGLDHVRAIAAGFGHGLAVRADGTVWAWGLNDHGQVGVPPGADCPFQSRPCVQAPVPVPGLTDVTAVAATDNGSFAVKADGTVWSWGEGAQGQLGTGSATDTLTATQVDGLTDVADISAGGTRVVVLRGDGTVWGWGGNGEQRTPTPVVGLDGVVAVSAGLFRHVALKADGSVWTWGEPPNPAPAPVDGLGSMVAIAGGGLASGAIATDGTVWYWGLSLASISPKPPTQAKDLSNIVAIVMHLEVNMALKADGTVWTWREFGTPDLVPAPITGTPIP